MSQSSLLPVGAIKHSGQNQRRGLIWFMLSGHSPLLREVVAGSEAGTMEERCLLAGFSIQCRNGAAHGGLGPLVSINNQENCTQTCP